MTDREHGPEVLLTNDAARAVLVQFSGGQLTLAELRTWASSKENSPLESPYEYVLEDVLMHIAQDGFDVEEAITMTDLLAWHLQ